MSLRIVRLGSPRLRGEGLRIGTVRRLPRGVRRDQLAARDFFDVWLPELAPSAALLATAKHGPDGEAWRRFAQRYRREMQRPPAARLILLLAALSHTADLAVGCYCADEARCHRSVLCELFAAAGASLANGR